MRIAVVDGDALPEGFAEFQARYGTLVDPMTISLYVVARLAHPDFLVEIDAIAVR
jgi:hypothetical protein